MGFLMRNRAPPLRPFISQRAVFVGVYLAARRRGCEARLHRGIHTKPTSSKLNLLPLLDLSLTKRYTPRCSATLQSP
jgi:hypothetical protein